MQKFLNDPEDFVDEMLEGFCLAHADDLHAVPDEPRAIVRREAFAGQVTVATGGGSGHLPLFVGYVRRGLVDGCAVGNVFNSPSTDQMLAVTRAVNGGQGVLYLYGNYTGDRINFEAAAELAGDEGIPVRTLRGADDVASAPPAPGAAPPWPGAGRDAGRGPGPQVAPVAPGRAAVAPISYCKHLQ